MSDRDSLVKELELLEQLEPLVSTKQEIAVKRIGGPQEEVLAARQFFQRLTSVFGQVREAYRNQIEDLRKQRQGSAIVLFSSQQRLTGPITSATFRYFVRYLNLHPGTPIVIGSVGKERFAAELPDVEFTYVRLPTDLEEDNQELVSLVETLMKFKDITFVFGQYVNLVEQQPAHVTIGDMEKEQTRDGSEQGQFVFEPSLESIVSLFDRNFVALLTRQAASENTLAELGSQITAMEKADASIKTRKVKLLKQLQVQTRQDQNKEQRERLAGFNLWFKR